jgi:zinc finger protein DZIP1
MQIAYTDIDALERVVGILAHGDIVAENTRDLTETNFVRIFRLAQLALEYLLHVQNVLSTERRQLLASECASC